MKNYPQELVNGLYQSNLSETRYETDIPIKPIPDDPRPGVLDPRELEFAKRSAEHSAAADPDHVETLEEMRADMGFPGLSIHDIAIWTDCIDLVRNGHRIRIWKYFPRFPERKDRHALIYIHGGGWIGGNPMDYEGACKYIAELADCVVFNVDYSLAPELKYPNGFDDCFSAITYIYEHASELGINPEKIGIAGDSAGGNLSAACCLKDRDLGTGMIRYAALLYPSLKFTPNGPEGFRWCIKDYSISEEQADFIDSSISIDRPRDPSSDPMKNIRDMYLKPEEDPTDSYISPMFAVDYHNLPKTLVVTAEFDGLRIEDEYYVSMLRKDGVDARAIRYNGMRHGFIEKTGYLPQAEELCMVIAEDLKKM